jgi:hypothetical protein
MQQAQHMTAPGEFNAGLPHVAFRAAKYGRAFVDE